MVRWPSGLRRQTKDLVRKGVGSNPTLINKERALSFLLYLITVRYLEVRNRAFSDF